MYLLIEHNGTSRHRHIFEMIEEHFEDNLDGVVEETVQDGDALSLYDKDLQRIVSFKQVPTSEELRLLFNLIGSSS